MFAVDFPSFKNFNGQDVKYIQPKHDGHLAKIFKGKTASVFSKNDIDLTDKVMSCSNVKKVLDAIPFHSIAFGELHCPGIHATSVPTLLNDGDSALQLSIFAAPLFATRNLFNKDLLLVAEIVEEKVPFSYTAKIENPDIGSLLRRAEEMESEGWVLKVAHMKGWYKLKPPNFVDAFVVGTQTSFSANHYGEMQGIVTAVYHNGKVRFLANVGSGFSERYRKEVNRLSLVGRVCEIKHDGLAADGKLKFPRFVRWREDKNKEDCTWEQL